MAPLRLAWLSCAGFFLSCAGGCQPAGNSMDGFILPEGRAEAGERAFTRLGCNACHIIDGREDLRQDEPDQMQVPIGRTGTGSRGELATSILNPSHRVDESFAASGADGEISSPMRNYRDLITVGELADLVAFLQSEYE